MVERSAAFVQHLRERFRGRAGDACRRGPPSLVPALDMRVDAIVSCLPSRSLPRREVKAIVAQWRQVLRPGGVVIQFSYDIRPDRCVLDTGSDLVMQSSRIVWADLPPARIVTMQLRAPGNAPGA